MGLFWKRKEKERIQDAVPSFFYPIGTLCEVTDAKDARIAAEKERPCRALFVPSSAALESPRAWANALSSAAYLVVLGNKESKAIKALMSQIDNIIFSPVPRRLSTAFVAADMEEAERLLEAAKESFPSVITIVSKEE